MDRDEMNYNENENKSEQEQANLRPNQMSAPYEQNMSSNGECRDGASNQSTTEIHPIENQRNINSQNTGEFRSYNGQVMNSAYSNNQQTGQNQQNINQSSYGNYSNPMNQPMNSNMPYQQNQSQGSYGPGYNNQNINQNQYQAQNMNQGQTQNYGYKSYQPNPYYNQNQTGYTGYYYKDDNTKKPKKKHSKKGFVFGGIAVAAVAFGLIAGGIYLGVSDLKDKVENKGNIVAENSNNTGEINADNSKSDKKILSVAVDTTEKGIVGDVSSTVENVLPAIVAINSSFTSKSYDWFGREYEEDGVGSGSGIIVAQDDNTLLIITNNHVIADSTSVEIVFCDDTTAKATVKGTDETADLAVLSVEMSELDEKTQDAIRIAALGDSTQLKVGEPAIAIGNALGYGQSVTVGYISAVSRKVELEDTTMTLLQTDAAINPGNSGGALINAYGEVIGINSVKYASTEVESIGYAIPISDAVPIINELMNRETLEASEQGYLGIDLNSAQDVTEMYAELFQMPVGIHVGKVLEGSPAAQAGLKDNSIITGINGKEIKTIDQLKNFLSYTRAGEKVTITVQIKNNGGYDEKEIEVTLGNRPEK